MDGNAQLNVYNIYEYVKHSDQTMESAFYICVRRKCAT